MFRSAIRRFLFELNVAGPAFGLAPLRLIAHRVRIRYST